MCIVHSTCVLIRNYQPLYLIIEREQTTEQQQEQQQTNDKYAQIDTSDKIQTSSQIYENTGGMCMHAENALRFLVTFANVVPRPTAETSLLVWSVKFPKKQKTKMHTNMHKYLTGQQF